MDVVENDTNIEPSDWQINANNPTNTSIGTIQVCNSMVESSGCSTGPMVEPVCPPVWDQPLNGPNSGYSDVNIQSAMLRGSMFLPPMLPQSLPNFPADSAFIERAARFSCLSGVNFSEMMNPFTVPDPLNPYTRLIQGPHEVLGGNGLKSLQGIELQRHDMNMCEVSKDAKHGPEGSPFKNEKRNESVHDEVKQRVNGLGNESEEAEFSGRGPQEELDSAAGEFSAKGLRMKKRKRGGQDQNDENNEAPKPCSETGKDMMGIKQKEDRSKPNGKNVKQGSQGSDGGPKEEYIHVRARRGQATNSHSLAERVRREKISERMKFLQDLVPGCSKVTGKAVMLDEIINYVQSLQRQVEFLSMKLATVNPRLDFNIEGLLAKDMLQHRASMSSSLLGLLPDMSMHFPPIHPPQPGLIQACLPVTFTDTLRRPTILQGFKEFTSQVASVWEDELHNVVHMGLNSTTPLNNQDLTGSLPQGHMKAEQ